MHNLGRASLVTSLAFALIAILLPSTLEAQDLHPSRRPSPTSLARAEIGDAYVSITYSRPYKRGRDNIFGTKESGALVPYGEVWRTGANEATQVTATKDIKIGGKTLPAGTYSLFSTPGEKEWTLHFNSRLLLSGTFARNAETGEFEPGYDAAKNVLDVTVTPSPLEEEVDQFTIRFDTGDAGDSLILEWIKTQLKVPVAPAG
jgi:hypothetical protein